MSAIRLRPYQQNASRCVLDAFKSHSSVLVVMATGLGKTCLFTHLARDWRQGRVLVLAHREELIAQAAEKAAPLVDDLSIEMGQRYSDEETAFKPKLVLASVQTLSRPNRLARFSPEDFGLVVVDEAHHAVAPSYRRVLDHFQQNENCKTLGVTATPRRADDLAMGQVFEHCCFDYGIEAAIEDGWLVPVRQKVVHIESLDFSTVRTVASDFNEGDLERILTEEEHLHQVAAPTVELAGDQPALVFCVTVAHARLLADVIGRYKGKSVAWLCGETDSHERQKTVQRFRRGEIQFLCNVGLFLEGFDAPNTAFVIMARPTKSLTLYCLDQDTEILTDKGWVGSFLWESLDDTYKAAGYNLETGQIEWTEITGKYRRPLDPDEKMYHLKGPHFDLRVTEAHRLLWRPVTENRANDLFRLMPASELASRLAEYEMPVSGIQPSAGLPLTDDEIRFIGWYLTDGTISKSTNQFLLRQAAHQPWIPEIEKCLQGCGFKYTRREFVRSTNFSDHAETVEFTVSMGNPRGRDKDKRGWGGLLPYMEKNLLPRQWEEITPRQLSVLLEVMHLGDGCKNYGDEWVQHTYRICTGNRLMANRLQSLCVRRGFRCMLSSSATGRKKPIYYLNIKRTDCMYVGGGGYRDRPVLVESPTTPGELVWCVTTGTSTIITRRNGHVTLMGQTQVIGRGTRPLPGVIDPYADGEPAQRRQAIAQSAKPSMCVLDFAGNAGRHKIITAADVLGGKYGEPVRQYAKKCAQDEGRCLLMDDALAQAQAELELLEEEQERERRRQIRAQRVAYDAQEVSPFSGGKAQQGTVPSPEGPSPKQWGYLRFLGMSPEQIRLRCKTRRQASVVIDILKKQKGIP